MSRAILSANPYEELGLDVSIVERLAASTGRGGPDNSDLTERGIRGLFLENLELGAVKNWALQAGLLFESDAVTEKHRWLGQVPEPRKHFGGLNLNKLRNLGVDITNEAYETSIWWAKRDWKLDKTSCLARRVPQLATAYLDHWNKLLVDLMVANAAAYDGVALFATAHSIGDSGTMDNALVAGTLPALNVTTAARPTRDESIDILSGMASHFFTFKDDQGRPANQAAGEFLMVCPPAMAPGMIAATRDLMSNSGSTNPLSNLGWKFGVAPEARLTNTAVCYLIRVDDKSAPAFILQEEDTPSVEILGEGSEHWIKNNEAIATAKASRAVGAGDFKKIIRGTLS